MSADLTFRRCSICRREIEFEAKYWVCSVSTCNRSRTALFFCSVACWDAHLGEARHREAWAEERLSPSREAWARELASGLDDTADIPSDRGARTGGSAGARATSAAAGGPGEQAPGAGSAARRVVVAAPSPGPPPGARDADVPRDVLVVVSKLKAYVRARSGMNTSDTVVDALSDHLRRVCDDAIRNAAADGRKTVMDRDFRFGS